jgi:hypothetical protein
MKIKDIHINDKKVGEQHEYYTMRQTPKGFVYKIFTNGEMDRKGVQHKGVLTIPTKHILQDGSERKGEDFEAGTIVFTNRDGHIHKDNGPAIVCMDGFKAWYENGKWIRSKDQNGKTFHRDTDDGGDHVNEDS